jgi:hypothetical protein
MDLAIYSAEGENVYKIRKEERQNLIASKFGIECYAGKYRQ